MLYLAIDNNIWGTEHERLDIYNMIRMVYGKNKKSKNRRNKIVVNVT